MNARDLIIAINGLIDNFGVNPDAEVLITDSGAGRDLIILSADYLYEKPDSEEKIISLIAKRI